jgi:hypothetical protein
LALEFERHTNLWNTLPTQANSSSQTIISAGKVTPNRIARFQKIAVTNLCVRDTDLITATACIAILSGHTLLIGFPRGTINVALSPREIRRTLQSIWCTYFRDTSPTQTDGFFRTILAAGKVATDGITGLDEISVTYHGIWNTYLVMTNTGIAVLVNTAGNRTRETAAVGQTLDGYVAVATTAFRHADVE